jgi:GDP-L-fucose synthase
MFEGRHVLVTGGTGMVGRPLVELLLKRGARVRVVSLDSPTHAPAEVEFQALDLRHLSACMAAVEGMEFVFQLAGVKGSPAMCARQPASFFVPTLMLSINMMEAARRAGVQRYLYTSSVGVYQPAEVLREDDVWTTFPSPHDRFAGWAKRMGELQADAMRIEYGWDEICIVRPANVYGPWDNFDPANAMVIPALIRRALDGERPLKVWGDGSAVRDFIHARDCASGMLRVFEQGIREPVNLASGTGISIKQVAEAVAEAIDPSLEIVWDSTKPTGDARRVLDTSRAESYGIRPQISLRDGIRETVAWLRAHGDSDKQRYNAFTENEG